MDLNTLSPSVLLSDLEWGAGTKGIKTPILQPRNRLRKSKKFPQSHTAKVFKTRAPVSMGTCLLLMELPKWPRKLN